MKKLIILLAALPLVFSSCFKEDDDKFALSTSERINEVLVGTEQVLTSAPNGWLMEYYPGLQYGGVTLFMKFENGAVTVMSEHGGSKTTEKSFYAYDQDMGPVLAFDTYNSLFHVYSEPNSGVGTVYAGMEGDREFVIVSYASDYVELRGKLHGNRIEMTPLPADESWEELMDAYLEQVTAMDMMLSYKMTFRGQEYEVARVEEDNYQSRYFEFLSPTGEQTEAPFIYTMTGLKFYEPVDFEGVLFDGLLWKDGKLVDEIADLEISAQRSDVTFALSISDVTKSTAAVKVTPSKSTEYFYVDVVKAETFNEYSEPLLIKSLLSGSSSYLQKGPYTLDAKKLKPETDYVACVFGVGRSSSGNIYATTGLTTKTFRTDDQEIPTEEYLAWIGKWQVTNTSSVMLTSSAFEAGTNVYTFEVDIEGDVYNETYSVTGLDCSVLRNYLPVTADFIPETGGIGFSNDQELAKYSDDDIVGSISYMALCSYSSGFTFVSGDYYGLVGSLTADGAELVGNELTLSGGMKATVVSMIICVSTIDGAIYFYTWDTTTFAESDFPVAPFKMTRLSSASALSVPVPSASQISVCRGSEMLDLKKYPLRRVDVEIRQVATE